MVPNLRLHLLGDFLLLSGDKPLSGIDVPRLQSLLAYLVLHHNTPQPRSHLAYLLWPDSTESQAHTNLRNILHKLRQSLPNADTFLQAQRQELQWQPHGLWTVDVLDFEQALTRAEEAERAKHKDAARQALVEAVNLYQGDLLPSCYDEWILPERDHLRQAFLKALERLIGLLEEERDYEAAISAAQRLLRHDPLHEATYRHLMRLYAVSGDRVAALRTYYACTTVLEREMGVAPGPSTREFYERLVRAESPSLEENASPTTLLASVPLVGRQPEWAQLQSAWHKAVSGQPHLVLLSGEVGIGKTRLAEELLTWVGRQGIATAEARCYAVEGGLSSAPIAAWLRTDILRAGLARLPEVWLTEVARLLPDLLVERPELPRPAPLTESWQHQHLFEALARAVLSDDHPLLLLLDDVQWCDRETLEWLYYLLRFYRHAPLLLVGTVRTEEIATEHPLESLLIRLRREGLVTEIALAALNASETAYLAAHLAGYTLDSNRVISLFRETEGNPLFVVETVRAGALENKDSAQPQAEGAIAQHGSMLPPTVQAVITARLTQLSPAAREVGSTAAVIGRAFTFDVLARACGSDEDTLVRALDELWQRRIIREQAEDAYDFSHGKLRECAYTALSHARRRLLHRRVAEALESVHASKLDAVSGQIAVHYEYASLPQQAISYYQLAGEVARKVYANTKAITSFRKALSLLETTSPGGLQQALSAQLYEQVGDVLYLTGQNDEARGAYQQALAQVPVQESTWRARLLRRIAKTWETQRSYDEALHAYQMAEDALGEQPVEATLEWWREWIEIQDGRIEIYYWLAQLHEMNERIKKTWVAVEEYGTPSQRAAFFLSLAGTNLKRDRYVVTEDTLRYARIALAAYRETGNLIKVAWAQYNLGFCHLLLGDLYEAEQHMQAALAMAEQTGDVTVQSYCLTYLTLVKRKRGQVEETQRFSSQALIIATAVQRSEDVGASEANLAWAALCENKLSEAQVHGQIALKMWQQTPLVYPFHWTALLPLICVALVQNQIPDAVNYAQELLAPEQQCLPDPLTAALKATIQAWNTGQPETAQTQLARVVTLAQELGYL